MLIYCHLMEETNATWYTLVMNQNDYLIELHSRTAKAVAYYWQTRSIQLHKQQRIGKIDQGLRSAVTGGAQMGGFIELFADIIKQIGIPEKFIFRKKALELPGFFRPTKE